MSTEQSPDKTLAEQAVEAAFAALPPIFRECVDDEPTARFDLRFPFVVDDYVYATDARIGVRTRQGINEVLAIPPSIRQGKYPSWIRDLFEGPFAAESWPCPGLLGFEWCEYCEGSRQLAEVECESCDRGTIHVEYGPNFPCHECRGRGGIPTADLRPCWACRGSGFDDPNEGVLIAGVPFGLGYASRIARHGGRFHPASNGPHCSPCRFVLSDGTEGILMPLSGR